jgi:uncharacterized protein (DUF1800 family)
MNAPAIALNRFGLGARPSEPLPADPQRWLLEQFDKYEVVPVPWGAVRRTSALVDVWLTQQREVRKAPQEQRSGIREAYLRTGRDDYVAAVGARTNSALQTSTPFMERLVHFWSNHFAVSVDKLLVIGLAGGFEADAIRPNILGKFEDLLLAVVQHPAMLLYLDQAQSTGPASLAAQRPRSRPQQVAGLNENLAREILELHTLGVRSGYTQEDVTEFARALTGWTLPSEESREGGEATFRFVPALHEPGSRKVLGRTYPNGGEEQARSIIHDVATSPETARHIATKLARHFVADDPPAAVVQRLAATFVRTGGDLAALYRHLIASEEPWQTSHAKFKTPWEWAISSLRVVENRGLPATQAINLMNQLGQPVWRPGSPAGYDDIEGTWAAPDALLRRVEAAQRIAERAGNVVDARVLAPKVLPQALSPSTARAISRAESGTTALALLLVSPDFLRR